MKFFIETFGCQQNHADSERIEADFIARGMTKAKSYKAADYVVVNTCMIRQKAEDRVYGLVINLGKIKDEKRKKGKDFKIIVTGCMVGLAFRDKTGKFLKYIKNRMPQVDEFMPIEEVGFDFAPIRSDSKNAWVPISNGCNNFCTFCIVPFTRGREISRPYKDIIDECLELKQKGYENITLLGQNVNSYGADLLVGEKNVQVMRDIDKRYFQDSKFKASDSDTSFKINSPKLQNDKYKPVYVKHLGRYRIPTLFPQLLEEVARMGFKKVDFMSSNPWDFSDELIDVIVRNKNITRLIHLPVQSGDDNVLRRMNRWYSQKEYLNVVNKLKKRVPGIKFSTDIIVGFCGETEEEFENTVKLAKIVDFEKAYLAMYSPRFNTAATKVFSDDVPHSVKRKRWEKLENLINLPHLKFKQRPS